MSPHGTGPALSRCRPCSMFLGSVASLRSIVCCGNKIKTEARSVPSLVASQRPLPLHGHFEHVARRLHSRRLLQPVPGVPASDTVDAPFCVLSEGATVGV